MPLAMLKSLDMHSCAQIHVIERMRMYSNTCGCFQQIRHGDKLIEVRDVEHAHGKCKDGVGGWMFFAHGRAILDAQAMRDRDEDRLRQCPVPLQTAMNRKALTQNPEYLAMFRHVGQWGTALVRLRTPY